MKILLLTPPLTQLNTPYPATAALTGFLRQKGYSVAQDDLGIRMVNRIYCKDFLSKILNCDDAAHRGYISCVDSVVRFLQGKDNTLAPRIASRNLLPEGPRFQSLVDMEWAFGTSSVEDKARYLATLMMEDIADYIRENIDPHFDLIRYAEQISTYAPAFDELETALQAPGTCIDEVMLDILEEDLQRQGADLVGFAVPFPGCFYGALRCCQYLKEHHPQVKTVIGGGFVNTELRQIQDNRLFQYVDYLTFDDGELPLWRLAQYLEGRIDESGLVRTLYAPLPQLDRIATILACNSDSTSSVDIRNAELPAPDYSGLPSDLYISMAETTNPMHRLWSNGRWNKLMMAHGCYWHKCAFCDTTLDYIARYDAPSASAVVDRMEKVARQTGISGFHFVDEALPPKLLREVSEEILRRGLVFTWWGNIRFEKAYTQELCDLMADAGCVAVSGGLELASDRLLKLINKGVTVEQTVETCRHFRQSGIMVHTYLMYGFPTETLQETINALETVRRMFDEGIVQSAFWHRFAMTCHSQTGKHPEQYHARRLFLDSNPFCNNEVEWDVDFNYDIEAVGDGLRFATYNYMNEIGLDMPLKRWFTIKVPKSTI